MCHSDPKLCAELCRFFSNYAAEFKVLEEFIVPSWRRTRHRFFAARESFKCLNIAAQQLPEPSSPLLKVLVSEIKALGQVHVYRMFQEKVCTVKSEVKLAEEAPLMNRWFKSLTFPVESGLTAFTVGITGAVSLLFGYIEPRFGVVGAMPLIMLAPMLIKLKRDNDEYNFFHPLANRFNRDQGFLRFADSIAMLDELHALASLKSRFPGEGSFATIHDAESHFIRGSEVHNPTIALTKKLSVANDLDLGKKPWAITGPNSGGKSTLAITAGQIQSLGQAGARVPGKDVHIGIADNVFYQAQAFNALEDDEGRFGTELSESRTVLHESTSRTLRIFDELAQGTTHGESNIHGGNILRAHNALGGSTIFITHDGELVRELADEGTVIPKKIAYRKGIATHRLIDGISFDSDSDRVASKLKMDADGIEQHLKLRGIKPNVPLRRSPPKPERHDEI